MKKKLQKKNKKPIKYYLIFNKLLETASLFSSSVLNFHNKSGKKIFKIVNIIAVLINIKSHNFLLIEVKFLKPS